VATGLFFWKTQTISYQCVVKSMPPFLSRLRNLARRLLFFPTIKREQPQHKQTESQPEGTIMTATTARQNQTHASFVGHFGSSPASRSQPQANVGVLSSSEANPAIAKGESAGKGRRSFATVLLQALSAFAV
jgi:hypothetical protein